MKHFRGTGKPVEAQENTSECLQTYSILLYYLLVISLFLWKPFGHLHDLLFFPMFSVRNCKVIAKLQVTDMP